MNFENLKIWQESKALCVEIYLYFKSTNDFSFRDQITKSALSIPSNIAEGVERSSRKELMRFTNIAKASCGELRTQILIGIEIQYIDKKIGRSWVESTRKLSAMMVKWMKSFESNTVSEEFSEYSISDNS